MAVIHKSGSAGFIPPQPTFRSVTTWMIIKSTIRKDLQIWKRYKVNLVGGFVEMAIFTVIFGIFASASSFRGLSLSSRGMFIFFLGGLTLMFFQGTALFMPVNTVTRDLYNGTLEYIYSTPSSRYAYFIGSILADFIIRMVFFVPMYMFLAYYTGAGWFNMLMVLAVTIALMVVLTSFGVMIGMTAITWKQVGSMVGIVNILFQFMSGTFFPVQSLPLIGQYVAYLIPFTYAFDLVRYYSFDRAWETLFPVWQEWLILAFYAVFYALLTKFLLKRVERHAKTKGLHLI